MPIANLFFVFGAYQCLLHAYCAFQAGDPRLLMPHVLAYLHDLALLTLMLLVYRLLLRLFPQFQRGVAIFGGVGFFLCGILLASYPQFLREYLIFPVNLFDADMQTTETLIADYLGVTALWPAAGALLLGIGATFLTVRVRVPRTLAMLLLSLVIILTGLTLPRPSPQPFIFSLQQEAIAFLNNQPRVVPSLKRYAGQADSTDATANDGFTSAAPVTNYRHIVLLVFEGVTAQDFEREFLALPDGFYAQHQAQAVYFDRYYATNLDSYTSLIAMLTAIQVPYRAYADSRLYERVNDAQNVTRMLRAQGWYTAFFSTYQYQPFVPTRSDWDAIFDLTNLPVTGTWLTLGKSKMEAATEDNAALATIAATVQQHDHAFVLHELVYGHSPEWRATTGKTQLQYYDEYLRELTRLMADAHLLEDALLVIVSDHGDRAKAAEAENYRVPLLMVGAQIQPRTQSAMLNHLDLPSLIWHYAANTPFPQARQDVVAVGSSEKWVYGAITHDGACLFINDARGTVMTQQGSLAPADVQQAFQTRVNAFARRFELPN